MTSCTPADSFPQQQSNVNTPKDCVSSSSYVEARAHESAGRYGADNHIAPVYLYIYIYIYIDRRVRDSETSGEQGSERGTGESAATHSKGRKLHDGRKNITLAPSGHGAHCPSILSLSHLGE